MNKTSSKTSTDLKASFSQLTVSLENIFGKKAPAIPTNIKESIVKYSPYLILIVLILSLPPVLMLLGIGSFLSPFAYMGGLSVGANYSLAIVFLVISIILEAMAISGLMARKLSGWNLIYYSTWISAIYSLLSGGLINGIVSFAIGMWILFQVKSYYTK